MRDVLHEKYRLPARQATAISAFLVPLLEQVKGGGMGGGVDDVGVGVGGGGGSGWCGGQVGGVGSGFILSLA